jgi:hypothetical protein
MKSLSFFAAAVFVFAGYVSAAPVVDVPQIAGQEPAVVEKALGKGIAGEKTKYGKRLLYKGGKVEIIYINGKADWITVNDLGYLAFDESAPKALGFELRKPTFKNSMVMRWEPAGKLISLSVFELNGRVDYASSKVSTP